MEGARGKVRELCPTKLKKKEEFLVFCFVILSNMMCGIFLQSFSHHIFTCSQVACAYIIHVLRLYRTITQECTVLLIHGEMAAYFASPYVDAYGERHRSARGRPLFLNGRRFALVRGLWVKHLVAHEV